MRFIYGSKLSDNIFLDERGQLICRNVKVARDGYQDYLGVEIGKEGDYDVYSVYRPTEEVFRDETLASFENAPVTEQHPKEDVTVNNYDTYAKGFARDIRKETVDGINYVLADLVITDKALINKIQNYELREISCGYGCKIKSINGQYTQTGIIGNHIAVVDRGRAETTKIADEKGGSEMFFKKTTKTTEVVEEPVIDTKDSQVEEVKEEVKDEVKEEIKDQAVPVLDAELITFFNENKEAVMDMCSSKEEVKDEDPDEEEEKSEKESEKEEKVGDSATDVFSNSKVFEKTEVRNSVNDSLKAYAERQKMIMEKFNQGGNK